MVDVIKTVSIPRGELTNGSYDVEIYRYIYATADYAVARAIQAEIRQEMSEARKIAVMLGLRAPIASISVRIEEN